MERIRNVVLSKVLTQLNHNKDKRQQYRDRPHQLRKSANLNNNYSSLPADIITDPAVSFDLAGHHHPWSGQAMIFTAARRSAARRRAAAPGALHMVSKIAEFGW